MLFNAEKSIIGNMKTRNFYTNTKYYGKTHKKRKRLKLKRTELKGEREDQQEKGGLYRLIVRLKLYIAYLFSNILTKILISKQKSYQINSYSNFKRKSGCNEENKIHLFE